MLTDTALRNLKPKSLTYKASDRDGMYVKVSPTGTVTFRYDWLQAKGTIRWPRTFSEWRGWPCRSTLRRRGGACRARRPRRWKPWLDDAGTTS